MDLMDGLITMLRQNPLAGIEVMWGAEMERRSRRPDRVRIPWRGLRSCGEQWRKCGHHDELDGQNPLAGIEVMWGACLIPLIGGWSLSWSESPGGD